MRALRAAPSNAKRLRSRRRVLRCSCAGVFKCRIFSSRERSARLRDEVHEKVPFRSTGARIPVPPTITQRNSDPSEKVFMEIETRCQPTAARGVMKNPDGGKDRELIHAAADRLNREAAQVQEDVPALSNAPAGRALSLIARR